MKNKIKATLITFLIFLVLGEFGYGIYTLAPWVLPVVFIGCGLAAVTLIWAVWNLLYMAFEAK